MESKKRALSALIILSAEYVIAVRTGNVVAASDDVTSRRGPRIAQFVKATAAAVRRAEA